MFIKKNIIRALKITFEKKKKLLEKSVMTWENAYVKMLKAKKSLCKTKYIILLQLCKKYIYSM